MEADAGAEVVLDVDCSDGVFEFVLVNLGPGIATNVVVDFDVELVGLGGTRSMHDLPVWSRLRTLRPGKEIRVLFDSTERLRNRRARTRFRARVTWVSGKRKRTATYHHDLAAYRGLPQLVIPKDS